MKHKLRTNQMTAEKFRSIAPRNWSVSDSLQAQLVKLEATKRGMFNVLVGFSTVI